MQHQKNQRKLFTPLTDHTRITLELDPTVQHMRGRTNHGNLYFDAPYISLVAPNLYQGGCKGGLVLPDYIDHVVSLYPWEQYELHPGATRQEIRMHDDEDEILDQDFIDAIAADINERRKTQTVLVHCQAGLNRSGLIAGRALMLDGMTAQEAIDTLRERRSHAVLCNRAFEAWLLAR